MARSRAQPSASWCVVLGPLPAPTCSVRRHWRSRFGRTRQPTKFWRVPATICRHATDERDLAAGSLLKGKLAECLWWILVLADRLDVDITDAYAATLGGIETNLKASVARLPS